MELVTKHLKIIPCTEETCSNFTMSKDYTLGPHIDKFLNDLKKDPSLFGWGVWFVIDKKKNIIIGDIGFKGKPNDVNTVEIGYGITTSEQRKGYATEAVAQIIQWAFQFKNVDKIIAKCHVYNIPSIRVLEKLGMKQIGIDNNFLNWELRKKDLFKSK